MRLLQSFIAVLALGVASITSAAQPNLLFITSDDMNCDSVGVYGCEVDNITPNIDRLASQGLRFEHGHVTIAICQPTRAVWMTGRYPHRSGALGFDRINPGVPTLVEALKEGGYTTGILAKTRHVVPSRHEAFDVIVPAGNLANGRDPELYYKHTQDFLQQAKQAGKPFFLMANTQDPHRPFANIGQGGSNKKRGGKSRYPLNRAYSPGEVSVPGFLPDLPNVRKEIAQYYSSVHRADESVGAVLKALDDAGMADNTLVMFMSDHGMPLPFAKTNCWRHSTRTPWIVRWPGVVEPGTVDEPHVVSGIDVAPTFLDAAGLASLESADGRSIVPILKGEGQENRDHVITHINRTAGRREYPMRAVNDRRYGYIYNAWADGKTVFKNESQSGLTMKAMRQAAENNEEIAKRVEHFLYRTPEEFYDYQQDPDAQSNLIDDPAHAEKIAEFRQRLHDHMVETDDHVLEQFEQDVEVK